VALAVLAVVLAWPARAGHGDPVHSTRNDEPPTRFERFILSGCSPCVTESHLVATIATRPLKLPPFPRAGIGTRPGEVRVEVLRAYELGRPSRQMLALRIILYVLAPAPSGGTEPFRLAFGFLDEDEVPALVSAVADIVKLTGASSSGAGADSTDVSFRGGSVRIGQLRFQGDTVAYVQAGDLQALMLRPVWEVPTTVYLPPSELPMLATAFGGSVEKIKQLRGF